MGEETARGRRRRRRPTGRQAPRNAWRLGSAWRPGGGLGPRPRPRIGFSAPRGRGLAPRPAPPPAYKRGRRAASSRQSSGLCAAGGTRWSAGGEPPPLPQDAGWTPRAGGTLPRRLRDPRAALRLRPAAVRRLLRVSGGPSALRIAFLVRSQLCARRTSLLRCLSGLPLLRLLQLST